MRAQAGAPRPADVEIRAVIEELDAWEVLSSARCCAFRGQKVAGVGTAYIDEAREHDRCRDEVRKYARRRGYEVAEGGAHVPASGD